MMKTNSFYSCHKNPQSKVSKVLYTSIFLIFFTFFGLPQLTFANEQDSLKNWTYICHSKNLLFNSIDTIYQFDSYVIRFPNKTTFQQDVTVAEELDIIKDTIFQKLWRIEVIDTAKNSLYVYTADLINPKLSEKKALDYSKLVDFNIFQLKNLPEKIKSKNLKLGFIKEKIYNDKKCIEIQFESQEEIYNLVIDPSIQTPFNLEFDLDEKNEIQGALVEIKFSEENKEKFVNNFFYKNSISTEKTLFIKKLLKLI